MAVKGIRLVQNEQMDELDTLVWRLDLISRQIKQFEDEKKVLQTKLTNELVAQQRKDIRFDDPTDLSQELKVVYVANRRVSVDSDKVKAALGKNYPKVRSDEVDREKLDLFLAGADEETKARVATGIKITEHPTIRLYHVAREEIGDNR